ncbi:dual specificity protein phosphatase [Kutzneria sp. 744]|nr:dual specificity protein phosphatase [Kutzneria sp. 744]
MNPVVVAAADSALATRSRREPASRFFLCSWESSLSTSGGVLRGVVGARAGLPGVVPALARDEQVELACGGGRGRTGTALACLAVLDRVPAAEAVAYVRARYDRRAVETPWQRRYVARFEAS